MKNSNGKGMRANKDSYLSNKNVTIKKTTEGITLIALIIIIVVLLILAGVSIATLAGDNGVLTKASDAREATRKAEARELIEIEIIGSYGKNGKIDIDELKGNLKDNLKLTDSDIVDTDGKFPLTVTYENYEFIIEETGDVEISESKIRIAEFSVKGTEVKTVPVPEGFVHVGGTIEEGYVISDNVNDANKGVNSTELQGNQFVWVPVDKNQKVRINVSSEEEIESIIVTDPYMDEILNETNTGKTYTNNEINPTINGKYKVVVKTANETIEKEINVYSLYAKKIWELEQMLSDEFAKLKGFDNALQLVQNKLGVATLEEAEELIMSMMKSETFAETEEIEHVEKVKANGGFYIGRYEVTYEDGKVASKKATVESRTSNATPLANGMLWNYINQTDALAKAKAYNESLSSTLPTGAAWDRALCWLIETKEKTVDEIAVDSKGWGNYYDDNFSNTTILIKPGEFEETEANNIYDLAGNIEEWTTETCSATGPFAMGGDYSYGGSNRPASYRFDIGPATSVSGIGLRLTLFL